MTATCSLVGSDVVVTGILALVCVSRWRSEVVRSVVVMRDDVLLKFSIAHVVDTQTLCSYHG
jgi:hypothetical protein